MTNVMIAVHGGAGDIPDDMVGAFLSGCDRATREGLRVLLTGGAAEDAVEAAIRLLEDEECFDAGRGSFLNEDGIVELDAAIMEGAALSAGAVAGIRDIRNPISLARRVMGSPQVFLIGEGASRFAEQNGLVRCDPEWFIVPRERQRWSEARSTSPARGDTVGAVALDARGHLAAGVSTGGRPFKVPGRVGDVPCIGAAIYADDQVGAVSSSGEGEEIIRVVLAKRAIDGLAHGMGPQAGAYEAIGYLHERVRGRAGMILLDREGHLGCAFNTLRMARAWSEGGEIRWAIDHQRGLTSAEFAASVADVLS